ncbi:hypothetical protein SMD11_3386 [Streptomyces albireticuli]|uniref:Uncharacterized protein n=1 Tax=Streptomyces albireticuli TaxID=1940 RepID=A0A1Z2L3Y7_9ACTN|nr:hypothetical protein [Streptomyces albireticuli]ARZ69022.1 hypothetical protein SMD11_3386 [Streptomyces albireticuli]
MGAVGRTEAVKGRAAGPAENRGGTWSRDNWPKSGRAGPTGRGSYGTVAAYVSVTYGTVAYGSVNVRPGLRGHDRGRRGPACRAGVPVEDDCEGWDGGGIRAAR